MRIGPPMPVDPQTGPDDSQDRIPKRLPPAVSVDLGAPALRLWRERAHQVLFDTYVGIPLLKFPEDLRVYEHILWSQDVEVVLELLQVGPHDEAPGVPL